MRRAIVHGGLGALAVCCMAALPCSFDAAQQPAPDPAGAAAQEADEPSDADVRTDMRKMLRELETIRYPDGDESSAVGNEQAGNDMRSGTPALVNHDDGRLRYESSELVDRWRDLYAGDGEPSRPPRPVQPLARPARRSATPAVSAPASPSEPRPAERTLWPYPLVVGVALGLFVYVRSKARS